MDVTPRRLMAMTNAGFKKGVLSSFTIWLCASCYSCSMNCPKEIIMTDVMYTLKRQAIEERIQPHPKFAIPILKRGRCIIIHSNELNNVFAQFYCTYVRAVMQRLADSFRRIVPKPVWGLIFTPYENISQFPNLLGDFESSHAACCSKHKKIDSTRFTQSLRQFIRS